MAIYTLREVDNPRLFSELKKSLDRKVENCLVEFLDQDGAKPHVVFKLNFNKPVKSDGKFYCGCRLSMDFFGTGPSGCGGGFRIKLVPYDGSSTSSYASFGFPVKESQKVREWVEAIRSLAEFDFVPVNYDEDMAGCRDFITQCMIKWNVLGFVSWRWEEQTVPNISLVGLGDSEKGFHNLIGNRFSWAENCVMVAPHAVHRGVFLNRGVRRVEVHRGHHLPYQPAFDVSHNPIAANNYEDPSISGSYHVQYSQY